MSLKLKAGQIKPRRCWASGVFHFFRPDEVKITYQCGNCDCMNTETVEQHILPEDGGYCIGLACKHCNEINGINLCKL